ncbi:hypothetical protein AT864_01903 [Anoxybacillus sp. P3H1B]|uniref:hypothetical protein n=1 Tax=Anoxybacillus sp. P3H1B TaxID=1769293 RepID=UPI000794F801|nr:hypothetical protein [Anoxybacillus sp. P3H1B]KXG09735.1 hypothetical protein AT864_01903 [Anoxybacillus sp. P3H1B]
MKRLFLLVMFIFSLGIFVSANTTAAWAADSGNYEKHDQREGGGHREEKEAGGLIGWAAVAGMTAAFSIFPLRRAGKALATSFPKQKNGIKRLMRFTTKWHIPIGVSAFIFASIHGLLMYLSKEELRIREYIGISSVVLLAVATIFGFALSKNKTKQKLRQAHKALLLLTGILAIVHIVL